MFDRFTDRARKVMSFSRQEAERFNHDYIGTEYVLLGLVKEGSGVAANVLENLDIDLNRIRVELEKLIEPGPRDANTMGQLPFTPRAKKVLEFAIDEARAMDHNYVGTEHLILGLSREDEGLAAQVLMNLGLKLEDLRNEVCEFLGAERKVQHADKIETWLDSIFKTFRNALRFPKKALPEAKILAPDIADEVTGAFFEAEKLASARKHRHVGTEHFLIALCASDAFKALELDADAVIQKAFQAIVPAEPYESHAPLPLSSGSLHAIALAMKEAEARGETQFDSKDLLIAMIRENDGIAAKVLASFGITEEVARAKLTDKPGSSE